MRAQGNSSNIIQKQQTEFASDEQIKALPRIEKQQSQQQAQPQQHQNNNNAVVLAPVADQQQYLNGSNSPRKTSPRKNMSNSNSSFEGPDTETIE